MKRTLLAASSLAFLAAVHTPAQASSHREAPMIAGMPRLDASDFFMFRSYEPNYSSNVTFIADYNPLQDPAGGPNFFYMDHTGYYDINVDTTGTGKPDKTFRFRFLETVKNIALNVGGTMVPIPLINAGPINSEANRNLQNATEFYTVSLVTYNNGTPSEQLLAGKNGNTVFYKPIDNIGNKSIPDYPTYVSKMNYSLVVPGCTAGARVFVGQRKDPFVVNLGETFDLINYANPIGEQYNNSATDSLAMKNVTSLVLEYPINCLKNANGDPVIGAWTTSSMGTKGKGGTTYTQVSRLANPLVNELVIGLKDKDTFNGSLPANDGQFASYVTNPTVPALIQSLFPTTMAPTNFPRNDLVAVFLTGLAGVNAPKNLTVASEEMRLNTSIAPTAYGSQNRLGVIAGDNAGYPNGRRPGDDVVDITLRVAMGKLCTLNLYCTPSQAPSGALEFVDGAYTDDTHYLQTFPYVNYPLPGSLKH